MCYEMEMFHLHSVPTFMILWKTAEHMEIAICAQPVLNVAFLDWLIDYFTLFGWSITYFEGS